MKRYNEIFSSYGEFTLENIGLLKLCNALSLRPIGPKPKFFKSIDSASTPECFRPQKEEIGCVVRELWPFEFFAYECTENKVTFLCEQSLRTNEKFAVASATSLRSAKKKED